MNILGPTSMLLSTALLAAPKPNTAATEVEIEVIERSGSGSSSFAFVVPLDGEVTAWIDKDDHARRCEMRVARVRQGLVLDLDCGGSPEHALEVQAIRPLTPGLRTRLAQVKRPGGTDRQVFVTLR